MAPSAYRPDVDGLRAIAVLMVVAFHGFVLWFPSGFIGVDVFFVISGFLITRVILDGRRAGTFTYRQFYARRIRRLFPALSVVLIASLILGWFVLFPAPLAQLGRYLVAGAMFLSNVLPWSEAGYFDSAAAAKPLLHLWSLGIEEQFYVVWPVVLVALSRRRIGLASAIIAALLSFAWNVHEVDVRPVAAFYSPLGRAWELMAGCVLAHTAIPESSGGGRNLWVIAGIAGLAAAFAFTPVYRFPGWWALPPVVSTSLIIAAGPHTWLSRRVLAHPLLVNIGLISYPLYLWHLPLLVFLRLASPTVPTAIVTGAVLLLSVVLAWLTFVLVEGPIRARRPATAVPVLCTLVALAAVAGLITIARAGFPARFPEGLRAIAGFEYDHRADARVPDCWAVNQSVYTPFAPSCADRSPGKPGVVVWGDSHAGRLYPGVQNVAGATMAVSDFSRDSCPPLDAFGSETCRRSTAEVRALIADLQPRTVVLFARWNFYDVTFGFAEIAPQLLAVTDALTTAGVARVVVVGPAPAWQRPLPLLLYDRMKADAPAYRMPERLNGDAVSQVVVTDAAMRALLAGRPGVHYVSLVDLFCTADGCLTHVPGAPDKLMTWDYGHLTTPAAEMVAERLRQLGVLD